VYDCAIVPVTVSFSLLNKKDPPRRKPKQTSLDLDLGECTSLCIKMNLCDARWTDWKQALPSCLRNDIICPTSQLEVIEYIFKSGTARQRWPAIRTNFGFRDVFCFGFASPCLLSLPVVAVVILVVAIVAHTLKSPIPLHFHSFTHS
jgi:hypothetical protein